MMTYGFLQRTQTQKKLPYTPTLFQVAVGRREKLKVYGNDYDTPDGTGVRDYIHITDLAVGHVNALQKLFDSTFTGWKAYNLGTGQGYSVLDMIKAFGKASGKPIPYEIVGRREGVYGLVRIDVKFTWVCSGDTFEMLS